MALASCAVNATVDLLNARFASSQHHGVVMRAYDADPRLLPPAHPHWLARGPHPSGVVSASIVNSRLPYLFSGNRALMSNSLEMGHVGVILSPAAVHASLLCVYPRDAASIYVRCDAIAAAKGECVPGCTGLRLVPRATPTNMPTVTWCSGSSDEDTSGVLNDTTPYAPPASCAWRPSAIGTAMEVHEKWVAKALNGCPNERAGKAASAAARKNPWCSCLQKRGCCTHPDCQLYNELLLNATVLQLHNNNGDHPHQHHDGVESVYYLEQAAALSEESFTRSEAAAKALHRALSQHLPCVSLVAVDLRRERPFRWVEL